MADAPTLSARLLALAARAPDDLRGEMEALAGEADDLHMTALAFAAPFACEQARLWGFPDGTLRPEHYDTLAGLGARMASFTRGDYAQLPRPPWSAPAPPDAADGGGA